MRYSEKFISKYGRPVTICNENDACIQQTKCFIQPLRYKNKMYTQGTPTDIGYNYSGYYLLIAPPDFDADSIGESGYISDGSKQYHVDKSEKIYFGTQVLYIWAVLREHRDGNYPYYDHFR